MLEMLLFGLIMGVGFMCSVIVIGLITAAFVVDYYKKFRAKIRRQNRYSDLY